MNIRNSIVIVDDEQIVLEIAGLYVAKMGCTPIKVHGGACAFDTVLDWHDEILFVLLDMMMPDVDGLTVLKQLKSNLKTKDIPVIVQSGATDQKTIQKAFELGAADYLVKPYSFDKLNKLMAKEKVEV